MGEEKFPKPTLLLVSFLIDLAGVTLAVPLCIL